MTATGRFFASIALFPAGGKSGGLGAGCRRIHGGRAKRRGGLGSTPDFARLGRDRGTGCRGFPRGANPDQSGRARGELGDGTCFRDRGDGKFARAACAASQLLRPAFCRSSRIAQSCPGQNRGGGGGGGRGGGQRTRAAAGACNGLSSGRPLAAACAGHFLTARSVHPRNGFAPPTFQRTRARRPMSTAIRQSMISPRTRSTCPTGAGWKRIPASAALWTMLAMST